jgi:pimeloyl-ACP methyl ester carboxylesterase
MRAALARHDAIVRGAIEADGGHVIATGGDGFAAAFACPTDAVAAAQAARAARGLEASATPRSAAAQFRYIIESMDAREALRLIRVPTLVLHSTNSLIYSIEEGRYLADHIAGAKFVELPGGDPWLPLLPDCDRGSSSS